MLGVEPLSPGPWLTAGRANAEATERDKSAGGAHWLRHVFTLRKARLLRPAFPPSQKDVL